MAQRSVEDLTLREMFTGAERLLRELHEHLEQGFCPKIASLHDVVRPTPSGVPAGNVEDVTVRNHAAGLLESEKFTSQLYKKLDQYFRAIDKSVSRVVGDE